MKYPKCPYYEIEIFYTTFEMQDWLNKKNKASTGLRVVSIVTSNHCFLITIVREAKVGE
jgi:hypothetical protein